jgi:hypothetical protein
MAGKTLRTPESLADRFTRPVMDSAHEVWLAGLGAFAMARKESAKLVEQGSDLFDRLVAEGEKFEKRAMKTARVETVEAAEKVRKALGLKKEPVAYHLLPDGDGWTVRLEGSDDDLARHETKDAALDAARDLAHTHMPSRLVVHRSDGTIQTSYSYE